MVDEAEGALSQWRFTVVDGISRREALTMQFAENFHQSKPEPVQFARAARLIMAEDPSLTAAEVSRIVGAPAGWTRKALKLLDLPEPIVERVERGDLSFTAADLVRRGIARGDVTPDRAEELVESHAAGALSGTELKFGVGYVPPAPEDYAEASDRLDAARQAAAAQPPERIERDERADVEPAARPDPRPGDAELDGFVLGAFLFHAATPRSRKLLRIGSEADAHAYARSLHPHERLPALRSFAREALDAA
jgi:hypothetical protein